VAVYWCGMMPYYLLFAVFTGVTFMLRQYLIEPKVTSLPLLIGYGLLTYPLLLLLYFLVLFYATRGMKYFVARKPKVYAMLK
jgi:hypothetical protein